MRHVEEHLAECLAAVSPLPALDVALLDALDCVLAEDVESPIALPTFDNSSMDGYAVVADDVVAAGPEAPKVLPVVADIPAGFAEPLRLLPGTAARIMTGAPMPFGADTVIPVEWTDAGVAAVQLYRPGVPGQFVRRAGEDVSAGETVARAGVRLTPRHLALLAAVGRNRVLVHPRPRVVVISTGSELVAPGRPLPPGGVYDSNGPGLTAAALELGAEARHVGIVDDDPNTVLEMLEDQLTRADLLITSGGVSAGAYDAVKAVLSRLGTVRFERVAMQPGMPQGFGTIGPDNTPIFTLPGNPVSSMVSFEVFVRPVLRKMWGEIALHRQLVQAAVSQGWASPAGKRQFVRAALERREDGHTTVRPVGGHGSHLVADLADAACLAVVPEEVTEVKPGDVLSCMLLDRSRQ